MNGIGFTGFMYKRLSFARVHFDIGQRKWTRSSSNQILNKPRCVSGTKIEG